MKRYIRQISATDMAAIGLLLLLPGLFFWQALIEPAQIIREDAASYFQPYYTFAADEIQAGRLPLWNPYSLLGIPYHAGLQASLFYPLRWPVFYMDYVYGYLFLLWSHYFLTALAAYALMRVALGVRPLAALLGGISIGFGGFALGHLSHLPYLLAYPWFLGCFLAMWLGVQRQQWRWTIAAGVCIGLMALIGAVHLLLILGVLLGAFVGYHTICSAVHLFWSRSGGWMPLIRPAAMVIGAGVLGALIGAVQLMPAHSLTQQSVRQKMSWEAINMACAHPVRNTIQLVAPFYFGSHRLGYWGEYNYHGMAHHAGAVILVVAIVGLVHLGRDRHLWFLVVLALAGFLLGAGKYLPIYRLFYDWVPGFDQLRNPTRIFWCTDIALACLAAIGIDRTLGRRAEQGPEPKTVLASLGGSFIVFLILGLVMAQLVHYSHHPEELIRWVDQNPNVFDDIWKPSHLEAARDVPRRVIQEWDWASWTNVAAAVIAVVLLPVLILRRKPAGPIAIMGLVILLVGDLFAMSFGMVQFDRQYQAITETPPRAKWLQENLGLHRYLALPKPRMPSPDDQILRNRCMQFALLSVNGVGGGILESIERRRFCRLITRYPKLLNVAGVWYILSERPIQHKQFRQVHKDDRYFYYENLDCMPLVYFVRQVIQVETAEQALGTIVHEKFNPRETAVVYGESAPQSAISKATKTEVKRSHMVPGRWEIETETDAPTQLVISEGYDPGWRCRIGAQPTKILQTNDRFMSVAVPAGKSTVVLEYAPREFRQGAVLSLVGLVITVGSVFVGKWYHRRIAREAVTSATPSAQTTGGKPKTGTPSKRRRTPRSRKVPE